MGEERRATFRKPHDVQCTNCGHDHALHHAYGCDGNLGAEQAYWKAFETLPGYDQTREAISDFEAGQPKPCTCSQHRFCT